MDDGHRLLNRAVRFYVVQRGDTLTAIGRRLGVSWTWLAELNRIPQWGLIHPGQLIQIEN